MTPNRRARVAGIAATIAAIPFLLPTAASATGTLGQSKEPVGPPAPGACAGYLWTAGDSQSTPVLSKSHPRYVIPGLVKHAGTVNVTEAITWDARTDRHHEDENENEDRNEDDFAFALEFSKNDKDKPAVEKFEKMRVEYWKGDTLLAATPGYTPDLLDDDPYAWAVTPLGQVDLYEDADRVELVHVSQWWDGADDAENLFYPTSVCFTWSPPYTDGSVTPTITCDTAVLKLANAGTKQLNLYVSLNGKLIDYHIAPHGSQNKVIPLTEDTWTDIVVTDMDTKEVLWAKSWLTDCVHASTTTVAQKVETPSTTAPPTTVATQAEVLGTQVTAPASPDVLAFTGNNTAAKTGIGATLLALGLGLVTLGRRRKAIDA